MLLNRIGPQTKAAATLVNRSGNDPAQRNRDAGENDGGMEIVFVNSLAPEISRQRSCRRDEGYAEQDDTDYGE